MSDLRELFCTARKLTPHQRLAKIAALIQAASERTGKLESVVLNEAEVLGIFLLAAASPGSAPK
jgi:hypothetical protein